MEGVLSPSPSIRSQLILLVAAVAVPLGALTAHALHSETEARRRLAEEKTVDLAEATAGGVTMFAEETRLALARLARQPGVRAMEPEACRAALRDAGILFARSVDVFVAGPDGIPLCSDSPGPDGVTPPGPGSAWRQRIAGGEPFAVGRPETGVLPDRPVTVFAHAVTDTAGTTVGYVATSVAVDRLAELLPPRPASDSARVALAYTDGTVVTGYDGDALPPELATVARRTRRGISRIRSEDDDRVWGFTPAAGTDWVVFAGFPTHRVYAGLLRANLIRIGVVGLFLAGVLVLVFGIYRNATGSLSDLVTGVRRAAREGATAIPRSGPAEVLAVARAFERTLADRDAAEEALRRSTRRYESIFEHAIVGIYVSSPDGRFLEANPALARILGYDSVDEVMARPVESFYADPGERRRLVEAATEGRIAPFTDVEWRRRDGSPVHLRLYSNTLRDAEGEIAFEVLVEDLTERRALEEQLRQAQKLEAVGRLAGGVAHDFNNRLTVIRGQAEMLLADLPEDDPLRANGEAISQSADRAAALTSQLLAFSRKQVARPRHIDLGRVVENMGRMLHRVMGEDVEIDMRIGGEPTPIFADPGQIEQILLNLCTNARDAMPDGGALVLATDARAFGPEDRRRPGVEPGRWVVLTVRDTGHGMEAAVRERLFEPFFTTKPEGKGTGLGLSTVYGLVAQSGGRIHVSSAPGRGTSFEIYLPEARGTSAREQVEQPGLPTAPEEGTTVLVVEDEAAVRAVIVRSLKRAGYRVLEAADGQDALSAAASFDGNVDLLVTDIVMPGLKGPDLAKRLTLVRPGLPVLFVSGYAEETPLKEGDGAPRDFLAKPFTPVELLRAVQVLLERPPSLA